jgi:NADH dehydrogenase [ubiquinone] 1 alpha subcomplex assembly factor 7
VRQFVRLTNGWRERLVGMAPDGEAFAFVAAPDALPLDHPAANDAPEGSIVETCPAGEAIAAAIGARLARDGGAALIIDYGHAAPRAAATLQAVRGHQRHDVLADPGQADLTAHVDFAALANAARQAGAAAFGPVTQGALLQALGIAARVERLHRNATPAQVAAVNEAHHRLVAPAAMGDLFKALALTAPGFGPPAGFA